MSVVTMESLLNFCYYVTLFLIPITLYSLLFKHTTNNRSYTNRDWFYIFKLIVAVPAIKKYQKKCKQSLDEKTKKILENPKEIRTDIYTDNHFIYGIDQKGNSLSLRFTIKSGLVAEIFLCLRLATGAVYTFPGEKTKQYSIPGWQWKTKDLHIEILEPFKRLRVTFNGLLSNAQSDVEHVQFNFIWVSAGAPQFYPQDATIGLLADALARKTWKDGNWISLLGDERGYEQFGALYGFIRGDSFTDELELHLASCRTRFWCTSEELAVRRSLHLFVVAQDGATISLWVKDLKKGCTELLYGNVIMNNGTILPIISSDIRLDHLGVQGSIPAIFSIHVNAKKKIYRTVFHLDKQNTVTDHVSAELSNVPADCDQNTQQAKSLVEFWYCGKNRPRDRPPPLLLENKSQELPDCYVSTFEDEKSRIIRLTGGKGSSLAMLTSLKSDDFVVPNGFIVTVNAFNKQLEVNFNMKKAVAILEDICCGRMKGDLEKACTETVKTFKTERILPEIEKSVLDHLTKDRWAVRSSAIGEDSEELSAAGQNETFLGCVNFNQVLKAISACWASLFTYQSVQYRHQHGLPIASEMAVVVQRMVPSDCAGVLFTYHPSTGNPAQMVITANHGLGESVVSGRSEPDTIILERTFDNDLTIKSKTLGSKEKIIRMVERGVEEQGGVEGFSITDNQALVLGRVGVFLEEKFGGARDIEWAYFENRLFLLQSRPVTTLNTWSDFELLHEFDVAALSDEVVYSVGNTGEVLPGAISVLTTSTTLKCLDEAMQMSIYNTIDPYVIKSLPIFQHHLFIDVVKGIHRKVDKDINVANKVLDLTIFGHTIINKKIHSLALSRFGVNGAFAKMKDLYITFKLAWKNKQTVDRIKQTTNTTEVGIDTERDTLKDIYVKIGRTVNIFKEVGQLHNDATRTSITYQLFSMLVLLEKNKDFTVDHYNDAAMLLASCDEVVSAEIPNILANITKILIENKKNEEFLTVKPEDGKNWLVDNVPEAAKIFEKFVQDHGHRAVREFDLRNPTWGSNPAEIIRMIQANCKTSAPKQEKITKSVEDVVAGLVSPTRSATRTILKFLTKKSRSAVGCREQTKSEAIRFVNKIRIGYSTLGKKMALAGLIPEPDLIFNLSHYEIGQVLEGSDRSPVLISKALKRQKLYSKWDQLKFPEMSYGIPKPETRDFIPRTGSGQVKCEGTPACSGVIQARACVITDLNEIDQLQEGDVLITYSTDIGWSPYFPMLGGIVTELGGLVSHGAVIAREYGLPCIVGAKGVTKLFKTGDIVVLSGKNGLIELV